MAFLMTGLAEAIEEIEITPKPDEPTLLPLNQKIEEETLEDYDADEYYPMCCGDILAKRYEVVFKVGYGGYSTVWLAIDKRSGSLIPRYVALKVLTTVCSAESFKIKEEEIMQHITSTNPSHPGFASVRKLYDSFEIDGPKGKHMCLVHEPMKMDLATFLQMCRGGPELPIYLIKALIESMLLALDYLHSECHLIHTDIKPDNILLGFRDLTVLSTFAKEESLHPSPRKVYPDHIVYTSRTLTSYDNIGAVQLADFGLTRSGDQVNDEDIQPEHCRAPEVILGAKWSYSADIWNLACLVWYLVETTIPFSGKDPEDGEYKSQKHLAEIVGYIGLPPKELLERAEFGSTTFDEDGAWIVTAFAPPTTSLETSSTRLHGPEKALFLDFIRSMLKWLPEERKTARQLYMHEWLHAFLEPEPTVEMEPESTVETESDAE